MSLLLDRRQSQRYLLEPSAEDLHIVVPFDKQPRQALIATGNDPQVLSELLSKVQKLEARGGTDMYSAIQQGIAVLDKQGGLDRYFPAVIVLTDGRSAGSHLSLTSALKKRQGAPVPIFSITFGDADDRQLKDLSTEFHGRVFDGQKDLTKAFRDARGYN